MVTTDILSFLLGFSLALVTLTAWLTRIHFKLQSVCAQQRNHNRYLAPEKVDERATQRERLNGRVLALEKKADDCNGERLRLWEKWDGLAGRQTGGGDD